MTPEQKFLRFYYENPHVYFELMRLAQEQLDRGAKWISVRGLWEQLREYLKTRGFETYKLNNNFTRYYAQTIAAHDPRLAEAIEIRNRF